MTDEHTPGVSDPVDIWAIHYAFHFRNHKKWLSSPENLKLSEYVDLEKKGDFLEIGPQSGRLTLASLVSMGQKVIALDKYSYYPAWKLFGKDVKFVLGDADTKLPLNDNSIDNCVFMGAISYLSDPLSCLLEINRIMRRGGYLFLSCNKKNGYAHKNGLFDSIMKTIWDEDEIVEYVEKAGFKVEEVYSIGYPRLSKMDNIIWQIQKFIRLNKYTNKKQQQYKGEESFVCCVAHKTG